MLQNLKKRRLKMDMGTQKWVKKLSKRRKILKKSSRKQKKTERKQ
jgi:hypothetical protein